MSSTGFTRRTILGLLCLDLTPFADLLDWLAAAKMFIATGDSSELGRLIQEVQNDAYRNRGAYGENLPRALKNFGMALEEVSNDLLLARVPNLPKSVSNLAERQKRASAEVSQWAPPLTLLLDKIADCLRAVPGRQPAHASHAHPLVSRPQPHRASDDSGARVGRELSSAQRGKRLARSARRGMRWSNVLRRVYETESSVE
jgi:hypothetical protein